MTGKRNNRRHQADSTNHTHGSSPTRQKKSTVAANDRQKEADTGSGHGCGRFVCGSDPDRIQTPHTNEAYKRSARHPHARPAHLETSQPIPVFTVGKHRECSGGIAVVGTARRRQEPRKGFRERPRSPARLARVGSQTVPLHDFPARPAGSAMRCADRQGAQGHARSTDYGNVSGFDE